MVLWQARCSAEVLSQQGESHRLAQHSCLEQLEKNKSHLLPVSPISPISGGQGIPGSSSPAASLGNAAMPRSCPQPWALTASVGHIPCSVAVWGYGSSRKGGCLGPSGSAPRQQLVLWDLTVLRKEHWAFKSTKHRNAPSLLLY